jgi:phage protein D
MSRVPAFNLLLDGKLLTLDNRSVEITVTDYSGDQADELVVKISDTLPNRRIAFPRLGVTLACRLGWQGEDLTDMGTYLIDSISHDGPPDAITISGHAADLIGDWTEKREQSWDKVTIEDILDSIAFRQDVTPAFDPTLGAIAIEHIDQTDESDAHFLTRLAQRVGAVFSVKNGHLLFKPRGSGKSASGKDLDAITLVRKQGDRHTYSSADRELYTGVRARWVDVQEGKTKSVLVGITGHVRILRDNYPNQTEAMAAATAEYKKIQRGECGFTLSRVGDGRLRAEQPIKLVGYHPEIDAKDWVIKTATHRLDSGGYITSAEMTLTDASKADQSS